MVKLSFEDVLRFTPLPGRFYATFPHQIQQHATDNRKTRWTQN